eukprot:6613098-Prymnesium_polylepis.1
MSDVGGCALQAGETENETSQNRNAKTSTTTSLTRQEARTEPRSRTSLVEAGPLTRERPSSGHRRPVETSVFRK